MLKVLVGYPTADEGVRHRRAMTGVLQAVQRVLRTRTVDDFAPGVDRVYVDPALIEYAVTYGNRNSGPTDNGLPELEHYHNLWGQPPRGSINLILAARRPRLCTRARLCTATGRARHGA